MNPGLILAQECHPLVKNCDTTASWVWESFKCAFSGHDVMMGCGNRKIWFIFLKDKLDVGRLIKVINTKCYQIVRNKEYMLRTINTKATAGCQNNFKASQQVDLFHRQNMIHYSLSESCPCSNSVITPRYYYITQKKTYTQMTDSSRWSYIINNIMHKI